MIRIVLTDEQSKAITGVNEPIDLVDSNGRTVGRMTPVSLGVEENELLKIKRRISEDDGSRFTTEEVLDQLETSTQE